MKFYIKISCIVFFVGFIACKKETTNPEVTPITPVAPVIPADTTKKGELTIVFENMVGTEPLVFGKNFKTSNGDSFKISKFNYFISNIVITKDDNTQFTENNSYHLVKHSSTSTYTFHLKNIPVGSYKSIRFMIGVDSARNISGAQAGDLDVVIASDMFWSWSTGYIFLKLEGTAPKSGDSGKMLEYHIGGFGGVNKTQRNFNLNFGNSAANVSSNTKPTLRLTVDVNELFESPILLDFPTKYRVISAGAKAKEVADNYADMIRFKTLEN